MSPVRAALGALLVLVHLGVVIGGLTGAWQQTFLDLRVPAMTQPFGDFRVIAAGVESAKQGLDPMVNNPADTSRVIANIVTGVGFLGAGIIYRNSSAGTSHGLTTAATVWCTSAVGVAVGLNMFIIAIIGSLALYFLLSLHHQKWYVKWKQNMINKHGKENEND